MPKPGNSVQPSDSASGPRIVHVTSVHNPRDIRIFRKQCRSLQRHFGDVHLVAATEKDYVEDGVTVHAVKRSASRLARMLLTVPRVCGAARKLEADVYHLHDPELLLIAPILRRKARVIFDSHEDYPRDLYSRPYLKNWAGRILVKTYSAFESWVFRRIDAVITVNKTMTLRIQRVQPTTLAVYNLPIASELPEPVMDGAYTSKVVWLGLLNSARGVSTVNKAATLLPPESIEVIGNCDGIAADDLSLNALGPMPYEEAINRTTQYGAGLATFASREFHRDMFPIKLFEYMLMGLPIIASDFPKWRALVGESNCALFVDPDDPEDIARAIKWVLDNPEAAKEMGLEGRKLALQKFSWASEARKLVQLYEYVIGGRHGSLEVEGDFESEPAEQEARA